MSMLIVRCKELQDVHIKLLTLNMTTQPLNIYYLYFSDRNWSVMITSYNVSCVSSAGHMRLSACRKFQK